MIKNIRRKANQKGFTLIESIIALVLVAIAATMLFSLSQPLYNSAGAFSWFSDEMVLQRDMERILADYKRQRNDENNPFDPGVFRQYLINNYSLVDAARTGFVTFSFTSGTTYTASWPPQATIPSGAEPVLVVTLRQNERTMTMVFT